ncbi:DUF4132 domain-containing protein [Glycomyces sp. NPDC046736]|uniref:DUF4132 domain-containing protein n=1 Tax=Glycomyces sp. NPDC046736 TaxID=3155615 RepID=UPI0033C87E5E
MTEHVAPQQVSIELPKAFAAKVLPRRDRPAAPAPPALDPDAPQRLREALADKAELMERALHMRKNRRHKNAVAAYYEGRPDARGAAVTGELLRYVGPHDPDEWSRLELHAWLQTHGLAWTVRAWLERGDVEMIGYHWKHVEVPLQDLVLLPTSIHNTRSLTREIDNGTLAEIRAHLATAPEADYTAALAAAAEHRDTIGKIFGAALLFPERRDWVLDSCNEYRNRPWNIGFDKVVLHAMSEKAHLKAARITELHDYYMDVESIAALVDGLGTAALPVLTTTLGSRYHQAKPVRQALYQAVALLPTSEATDHLVANLDQPHAFDAAVQAAERHPELMLRSLAVETGEVSTALRGRFAALAEHAGPAALDNLTDAERAAIAAFTASRTAVPEADPADLPQLLTAPPWTRKRPRHKPVTIEGLAPIGEPRLVWPEGRHRHWLDYADEPLRDDPLGEVRQFWYEHAETLRRGDTVDRRDRLGVLVAHGPIELAEEFVAEWAASGDEPGGWQAIAILARFGEIGIPKAVTAAIEYCGIDPVLEPVLSVEAARFVADQLVRLKSARPQAAAWLDHHGLDVVPLLVPDAFAPATDPAAKRARKAAETALAHLAVRHGAAAVAKAAEPHGPEAVAALTEIYADPYEPYGTTVPKPGPWATPVMFPQVLLKGRDRALPASAIPHLLTVLALAAPDYPYPGLAAVVEICDRASLARFSRAVFDQWLAVGAPPKDSWALTQLAHVAEDETVWALAPRIAEWPGENQHKRAVAGLKVLGAIGSEEALRAVKRIADRSKFEALQSEAATQIKGIAAALGLTEDQLADRLVPDFGLDDEASLILDYGPRSFTVAFDEHMQPFVIDDAGKARKALPKPGVKDDPDAAEASRARFSALKRELKSVAAEQVKRLGADLVTGRAHTVEDFGRYVAGHPLTGRLARRLVWLAETAEARLAFRIAEDGTYSDVEDDTVDLPADASIRLAHPVHLGSQVDEWAKLFADYEILQPFDQLLRPAMRFTEDELATGRLARFEGATVATGRVLGMTRLGWHRAAPEPGGRARGISYPLPNGGFVTVALDPGIEVGYVEETPTQTIRGVHLTSTEEYPWAGQSAEPPARGPLDPVAASEALASLTRLTRP